MSLQAPSPAAAELEHRIEQALNAPVAALGFELVRVQVLAGGGQQTLQVMAERMDGQGMTVKDCGAVSHLVSAWLEQDVALADRFTLEVSSPGIDRPLVRLKDFERFQGHLAKVELAVPLPGAGDPAANGKKPGGMRRFQGKIARISLTDEPAVAFATETGEVQVPLTNIARAKLVITQELLDQGVARRQAHS